MDDAQFRAGDSVRKKSSPDVVGLVRAVDWDEQLGERWYRVQFGSALRGVPESDLEALPNDADPWADAFAGRYASARAFQSRLTFERLRKPPSRIALSFGSARAAFYPYQFKPLLKFLENPRQRLLIADDVGLGKTIEAGYILREMRARHGLERVLIVAPARLQSKWKDEMERRFDETFEVVRLRDLLRIRHRLERDEEVESFRWITSFEAARDDRFVSMLSDFEPTIDLVIVDEAHRMRNSSTAQHALGRALASCADGLVFLTATPVQTGIDNLFNLLRLLDEQEFSDFGVFQHQMQANRAIVRLANALRDEDVRAEDLEALLRAVALNRYSVALTRGEYFESIATRARRVNELDRSQRIDLQRDIAELSLTSHIISRTRKVEVLPDRPQRQSRALVVSLTESEGSFYRSIAGLCKELNPDLSDWGLAMATLMAYRYTASCIPAARQLFQERAQTRDIAGAFATENDDELMIDSTVHNESTVLGQQLAAIASTIDLHGVDSKFTQLVKALQAIWDDDAAANREVRKVVLFSFFKRTLRYLSERFATMGIIHRRIDGDMPIPDREVAIDEFASDRQIRVLLSSEVGAEGLDLQFASVVVNYDLPWNPMVVEQRIGRIDRIGQSSPKITIISLVAAGTVEERILLRLYERIGIFKETIGEIDPILGEMIERLEREVLRGALAEDELERQALQAADAFVKEQREAERLGRDADGLMAADQAFLDEVEALVGKRRMPLGPEIFAFVADLLAKTYPGANFPKAILTDAREIRLPSELSFDMRRLLESSPEVMRVSRKIDGGSFRATLNQQAALGHARAELIHARHPLVRFAFECMAQSGNRARAFAFRVDVPRERLPFVVEGLYCFSIWLFDLHGVRARTEIVPFFARVGPDSDSLEGDAADELYLRMLDHAEICDPLPEISSDLLTNARCRLDGMAKRARQVLHARESTLDEARHLRRRATLETTLSARVRSAEQRVADLRRKGAAEFAIRMAINKAEKAKLRFDAAMQELSTTRRFQIEDEEIAVGLVDMRHVAGES